MSVCRVPERWILGFHEVSNSEVPPTQSTVLRGEWSAASAPHSLLCSSTLWWFAGACCELMQLSNWAESIPEKGWRDCCWVSKWNQFTETWDECQTWPRTWLEPFPWAAARNLQVCAQSCSQATPPSDLTFKHTWLLCQAASRIKEIFRELN